MPGLLHRPIGDILRDRSDARRALLLPQIEKTLTALRHHGVVCELIGSFARAKAFVDEASDLDILVESKGELSEAEIWDVAWTHLSDVNADLVFADHLSARKVALMKEHARE